MAARILVVEDNRDNMQLMEYLLNAFGYTPLLASSAAEGIRLAREERPDLVLMDIQMPEMDGYEAMEQIKQLPGLESCPVVAVTAFAMVGDQRRIIASGFDGYISKPISPRSFVAEIATFLPADTDNGSHSDEGERS